MNLTNFAGLPEALVNARDILAPAFELANIIVSVDDVAKPIIGYENHYFITWNGVIISLHYLGDNKPWFLLPVIDKKNGYARIMLSIKNKKKTYLVHRLVAEAFLPNPSNHKYVNHVNNNRSDNRANNLEWCTASWNTHHGIMKGKIKSKLTEKQVLEIRRLADLGVSTNKLSTKFMVSRPVIKNIKHKIDWAHI